MSKELQAGTILLGKYRIEATLGRGGFGLVYQATDLLLGRKVAIKTLSQEQSRPGEEAFENYLSRFRREATVSAFFTHNLNVITVYGLEQDAGNFYLILEYFEAGSLADLLKNVTALPIGQACAIALDICNALAEVHQHPADIVHRDLKPGNILLRSNGQAVLTDFGIAQVGQESQRTTHPAAHHPGSPAYASPEQATGYSYLTPASDLYSLGLLLYQMLTGQLYLRVRKLPPSQLNNQIPPWLDKIIARLLRERPETRYQQAHEVAQDIMAGLNLPGPYSKTSSKLNNSSPVAANSKEESRPDTALTFPLDLTGSEPPGITPLTTTSPFIVAGRLENPADFIGRSRERDTLIERSYKGLSTSLVGERRIGKTWLMTYLRLIAPEQLGSRYRVVYLDASLESCRTVAGFVTTCLRELDRVPVVTYLDELDLSALETAVRDMRTKNEVLVLCLDEFERFGSMNQHEFDLNFFEGLRAIAGMGVALVTASKIPLMELVGQLGSTSPFFNIFEMVRLRPFTEKEVRLFVKKKASTITLTDFEQARLMELGQREPLRLQLVGDMICRDKRLALIEDDADLYRPDDPEYWQEFSERLEDKYRGMVQR